MNDIYVTLSGNVTDDPRQYRFRDGSRVTSMRMAVNRRVLDQQTNTWQTRDTTYYTVRCYRGLADNVQQSIRKGHPVVVYGKLRIKQFERDGEQRFWAEIEAGSVGHDLKWGIATFEKPIRGYSAGAPSDDERQAMEDATREWELTGRTGPGAASVVDGGVNGGVNGGVDGDDEAFDALVGDRGANGAALPAAGARATSGARHYGGAWQGDEAPRTGGADEIGTEEGATDSATDSATDGMTDGVPDSERGLRESGDAAWLPPALAA
ncbi:single-stranded DNA-binding protein [Microbispora sp. KK1-11]|uniref:single-stranded DNA-binding protein n=1 Tax=Microbispora sp. KK1-11 TaxID=2053005 RepID=UPI0011596588|nr:single-stranded DNA-binding protein [Microbispora sp. KK1-11]TQS30304.1 single-stranded DNA-binding protein [Microbispora sp. KK1-11]